MATNLQTRDHDVASSDESVRAPGFRRVVALVAIAASLVSLTGSWIPSLWGDEAASIMSATRSVPSLVAMLGSVDAVHGTYYLGLHAWIELFGASPFSVRLPSALAVGAMVAAVMLIARRLGSARIAIAAGIICAVIPRVTYMGAETRSSAFSAAIASWLTLLLVVMVQHRNPTRRWWLAYGALLALGTYVFLYVVLIAIAHLIIVVSVKVDRHFLNRFVASVAGAMVAASPVVIWALLERNQVAFLGHRNEISVYKLAVSLWFGQPLFAIVAWTLIACALAAAIYAWRSRASHLSSRDESSMHFRMPRLDVVAASWLLVPSVILIGGYSVVPVYTARYLSFCAPAAAILMAIGLEWAVRGRARVLAAALLVVVLCAAPVWLSQRQPNAKNNSDFAETSAIIAAHATPGDGVVFDQSVRPSRLPRLALHTYPEAFAGLKDVTLDVAYSDGTSWHDTAYSVHDAAALGRFNGVSRLWLVDYAGPSGSDNADRAALENLGYSPVREFTTYRSVIYEYVLHGTPA